MGLVMTSVIIHCTSFVIGCHDCCYSYVDEGSYLTCDEAEPLAACWFPGVPKCHVPGSAAKIYKHPSL